MEYLVRLKRHAMPPLTLNVCTVSEGSGDVTVKVHFDFTNNFLIFNFETFGTGIAVMKD